MADFLLELFSEEIPARMQARGADDLLQAVLAELGPVAPTASSVFYGPRRIGLVLEGLPEASEGRSVETRGPRVGSPDAAIAGFLRAASLGSIESCEQRDTGKGVFYFAVKSEPGQKIADLLALAIPRALDRLVWPKSMRWASHDVRWVRPLHNILAILYGSGRAAEIVQARWMLDRSASKDAAFLEANDLSFGHRFLSPAPFRVSSAEEHRRMLADRCVLADAAERKSRILAQGARLAAAQGLRLRDDPGLLDEVAGLVEWPVVRLGRIAPGFMGLPAEVLTTSMRAHQRYFALEEPDGALAPFFMVVANNETEDGGARIVAGNERVLRARLSDAQFFWDQDREQRLESRVDKLAERVFHAKLGSVRDKVTRVVALAKRLAVRVGADAALAERAALLAKADLSTTLVGEFPELQGVIGRYLAQHDEEDPEVADAIAEHYAPVGASDKVPTAPVSITVSLADKLDTLAAFFIAGEIPTGSKDPFALRRAALGVIRIVRENKLDLSPYRAFQQALEPFDRSPAEKVQTQALLMDFFLERLKVALKVEGVRHDIIAAVFAKEPQEALPRLLRRVDALQALIGTEDGVNLIQAYRRSVNILLKEAQKGPVPGYDPAAPSPPYRDQPEQEARLVQALESVERVTMAALDKADFATATLALAQLRGPVDDFFEVVTVNVTDPAIRDGRLRLLGRIRHLLDAVADFSKIEG